MILSDVALATSGMSRSIVFEGGAIHIRITRQGTDAGGFFFPVEAAGVLAYALERAEDRSANRQVLGRVANLVLLGAWVRGAPALAVQRVSGDGTEMGRPSVLMGDEIPALWRGLDLLLAEVTS